MCKRSRPHCCMAEINLAVYSGRPSQLLKIDFDHSVHVGHSHDFKSLQKLKIWTYKYVFFHNDVMSKTEPFPYDYIGILLYKVSICQMRTSSSEQVSCFIRLSFQLQSEQQPFKVKCSKFHYTFSIQSKSLWQHNATGQSRLMKYVKYVKTNRKS